MLLCVLVCGMCWFMVPHTQVPSDDVTLKTASPASPASPRKLNRDKKMWKTVTPPAEGSEDGTVNWDEPVW